MRTNKLDGNGYIIAGVLSFPIMVISSLMVSFNVIDALFLVFMIIATIRYFIIIKNN